MGKKKARKELMRMHREGSISDAQFEKHYEAGTLPSASSPITAKTFHVVLTVNGENLIDMTIPAKLEYTGKTGTSYFTPRWGNPLQAETSDGITANIGLYRKEK